MPVAAAAVLEDHPSLNTDFVSATGRLTRASFTLWMAVNRLGWASLAKT